MSNNIYWLISGDKTIASSRLQGYNVHNYLKKRGYSSHILYCPKKAKKTIKLNFSRLQFRLLKRLIRTNDTIIFQKFKHTDNEHIFQLFKKLGAKLVFLDCDYPPAVYMASLTDLIICPSEELVKTYKKSLPNSHIEYIPDAPEIFNKPKIKTTKKDMTCIWFGNGDGNKWDAVLFLKNIFSAPELINWNFYSISNHPDADFKWNRNSLNFIKKRADVIALPIINIDEKNSVKSHNRVVQAMALGKPVIASEIGSYKEIISNGNNGYFCNTKHEWISAFKKNENPEIYNHLALNAYEKAHEYSLKHVILDWSRILNIKKTNSSLRNIYYRILVSLHRTAGKLKNSM